MKFTVFIVLCGLVLAYAQNKYEGEIGNFNVEELLSNDRLLVAYTKCLLDKGPCTPEVKQVKDKLPEALETKCAKCTDRQKQIGKQLAKEMKKRHPDLWTKLVAKYDPEGKYTTSFQEYLA